MTVKVVSGQLEFTNQNLANKLRKKGHELVKFLDDYTMLDIETTGLSPYRDRITELAGIKVRNRKVVAEYSQLVKYPKDNKVPRFITKLNGIDEALSSTNFTTSSTCLFNFELNIVMFSLIVPGSKAGC